jgi:DNA-directed RNA polymerase specialized sigma24 family protein
LTFQHHDVPPAEIAERLQITLGEVKAAVKRLERARERLERVTRPGRRAGIGSFSNVERPGCAGGF